MSRIIHNGVRQVIGKKPRLTEREAEFIAECYGVWRGLAAEKGLHRIRCSTGTFNEHFRHDRLMAGPWEWEIDDSVQDGLAILVRRDKSVIGEMRVSELVVH